MVVNRGFVMKGSAEFIAGIFFGLMALIHLARLLCPFDVVIGSYHVALWVSPIIFMGAGLLSAWLFRSPST